MSRFISKSQIAALMGVSHAVLNNHGFYKKLKNHSASERFQMFDESEVLAKKQPFLDEYSKKKEQHAEWLREHGRRRAIDMQANGLHKKKKVHRKTAMNTVVSNNDLKERLRLLREIAELEKSLN